MARVTLLALIEHRGQRHVLVLVVVVVAMLQLLLAIEVVVVSSSCCSRSGSSGSSSTTNTTDTNYATYYTICATYDHVRVQGPRRAQPGALQACAPVGLCACRPVCLQACARRPRLQSLQGIEDLLACPSQCARHLSGLSLCRGCRRLHLQGLLLEVLQVLNLF